MTATPHQNPTRYLILCATPMGDAWLNDPTWATRYGATREVPTYIRADGLVVSTFSTPVPVFGVDPFLSFPAEEAKALPVALGVRVYISSEVATPDSSKGEGWLKDPNEGAVPRPCTFPLKTDWKPSPLPPKGGMRTTDYGVAEVEVYRQRWAGVSIPVTPKQASLFLARTADIGSYVQGGEISDSVALPYVTAAAARLGIPKGVALLVYDEGKQDGKKIPSSVKDALELKAWDSGSETELGIAYAKELRGADASVHHAVFDVGAIHTFDRSCGGWIEHHQDKIRCTIRKYEGSWISGGEKGESKKLVLSHNKVMGIEATAHEELSSPHFFATAASGFACVDPKRGAHEAGGLFIGVSPYGVHAPVPLTSEHRIMESNILPVPFDTSANCPKFIQFLNDVFEGLTQDEKEKRVGVIMEFFAACLMGDAPKYQQALVLVGAGANGKTTLLRALSNLFPAASRTAIPIQSWGEDYKRAMLASARVNICNELPAREVVDSESVKAIIDGSDVTARSPYKPPFTFRPKAGHIFAANKLPPVADLSDGFFRRFIVIDFPNQFTGDKANNNLDAELAEELPGILQLVLYYANLLVARGHYEEPESAKLAKKDWRNHNDSVAQWVIEATTPAGVEWTKGEVAYVAYKEWALRYGFKPVSIREYKARMEGAGVRSKLPGGIRYWAVKVRDALTPTELNAVDFS